MQMYTAGCVWQINMIDLLPAHMELTVRYFGII